MAFYTTEISEWNMENVVFLAQDEFGSKVQSDPVDFIVIPTVFSVDPPDEDTISDDDNGITSDVVSIIKLVVSKHTQKKTTVNGV